MGTGKNYEQNYFFAWRDGHVYYNELDTKVRLTKRKKEVESLSGNKPVKKLVPTTKAILAVKHRPLNQDEVQQQQQRQNGLTNEEDDDESSSDSSDASDEDEIKETGGGG